MSPGHKSGPAPYSNFYHTSPLLINPRQARGARTSSAVCTAVVSAGLSEGIPFLRAPFTGIAGMIGGSGGFTVPGDLRNSSYNALYGACQVLSSLPGGSNSTVTRDQAARVELSSLSDRSTKHRPIHGARTADCFSTCFSHAFSSPCFCNRASRYSTSSVARFTIRILRASSTCFVSGFSLCCGF